MSIDEGRIPEICVCVAGRTEDEVLSCTDDALRCGAGMIEWRADHLLDIDEKSAAEILSKIKDKTESEKKGIPLIFTLRSEKEGGCFQGDFMGICRAVCCMGAADMIDIEVSQGDTCVRELVSAAHAHDVSVVLSYHSFSHTPSFRELCFKSDRMRGYVSEGDIVKICAMPHSLDDVRRILKLSLRNLREGMRGVYISMGESGRVSRITGEITGMPFMYACITEARVCRDGQLSAGSLREAILFLHSFLSEVSC